MKMRCFFGMLIALGLISSPGWADAPFGLDNVRAIAQKLAQSPYQDTTPPIPPQIDHLDYDAMRDIRWKDEFTLWKKQGLPFQAQFSQRSGYLRDRFLIYTVGPDGVQPFKYSSDYFNFGRTKLTASLPADTGYGSFRIHYAINNPSYLDEVIVFAGPSYFRSLAKNQVYGLSCRGLAIDSGIVGVTEEFPLFTTFWLVQPKPHDTQFTLYALLDSPSVAGAYEFKLRPGVETQADVTASLYFRKTVGHLGIAPLTSMFWFGENSANHFGDFRPEVHDSDGMLIANGKGEWLWRPLDNFSDVHFNSFTDENPKGFGLMQRDRNFDHYQDLEVNYQLRPSCWVEPLGQWGKGSVDLVELPSHDETTDNIVLYWQPQPAPVAGTKMDVSYRLHWFMDNPALPPLARVVATRINHATQLFPAPRFVIDFVTPGIDKLTDKELPHANVSATSSVPITDVQVIRNPYDHSLRVSFTVPDKDKVTELRCQLQNPDGSPFSEVWTDTWYP
ncbi:MAG: glucan biosynthesis protein G [Methylacidiphilales bacterium]|nr:glucan biosynthesis protein G [Candidatus Methylacidiphilales bacterium]